MNTKNISFSGAIPFALGVTVLFGSLAFASLDTPNYKTVERATDGATIKAGEWNNIVDNQTEFKSIFTEVKNWKDSLSSAFFVNADGNMDIEGILELSGNSFSHISNSSSENREILQLRAKDTKSNGAGVNLYGNGDLTDSGKTLFFNGGETSVLIDTDGNVGIGTTSPKADLEIGDVSEGFPALKLNGKSDSELDIAVPLGEHIQIGQHNGTSGGGTTRMLISKDGNVGIGTNDPSTKLDVNGSVSVGYLNLAPNNSTIEGGEMRFVGAGTNPSVRIDNYSGHLRVHTLASGKVFQVIGGVGVKAVDFIKSSDERLKENVETVSGLEQILQLRGVRFDWKDSGKADVGVIAQEVEEVFPELVHTNEETGMKAVSYSSLVGPLIEATKSQQEQIELLKEENKVLKNQNTEILKRLELLEDK